MLTRKKGSADVCQNTARTFLLWYPKGLQMCRGLSLIHHVLSVGGGREVRWCWVNFQCRGVLLISIRVGQGPTALAVERVGVV